VVVVNAEALQAMTWDRRNKQTWWFRPLIPIHNFNTLFNHNNSFDRNRSPLKSEEALYMYYNGNFLNGS